MTTAPANLIASHWIEIPGSAVRSHNPAHPDQTIWLGSPTPAHVDRAVAAASQALPKWSALHIDDRIKALRAYQNIARQRVEEMASLIMRETGKAAWDSLAEAKLLADKVDITLESGPTSGLQRVTPFELHLSQTRRGRALFRPHGVMAVLGPFNFPAHLPNGHIVPALLMGNTIVFKPSDKTPAAGQLLASWFNEALDSVGAPPGVFNMVHGAADVASALVNHDDLGGILFTGSWPVGRRILEANLDRPGRMIALEMGGNNATIVMPDADLKQAAIECVRSAFITTGQRCTCTRRVIVHEAIAKKFIPLLQKCASTLIVGEPAGVNGSAAQPVFMGPIIREESRQAVLHFQRQLGAAGGRILMESTAIESPTRGHYLTPSIVQVDRFSLATDAGRDAGCDVEIFGPLMRLSVTTSFEDALAQANASRYGLAASLFTHDQPVIDRFMLEAKAGCLNVNTGTAGASSKLPFGGLDQSGNHRPAGAFSLDYCAYPVASMHESSASAALPAGMQFDDTWTR